MRRKITDKDKKDIKTLASKGFGAFTISSKIGLGASYVDEYMKENDIVMSEGKVKKITPEDGKRILELTEEGSSVKELAEFFGYRVGTVEQYIKNNYKGERRGRKSTRITPIMKEKIIKLYKEGKGISFIVPLMHSNKEAIITVLKEAGLKIEYRGGKARDCEEIKPIIAKLYDEGYNTEFIAKEVHTGAERVCRMLKEMGYTLRAGRRGVDIRNMNQDKKNRVISLGKSGASIAYIVRRTGLSESIVRKIMVDEKLFIPKGERVEEAHTGSERVHKLLKEMGYTLTKDHKVSDYEEIKPIIAKLYDEGYTAKFIAKELYINSDTVSMLLKGMGYTLSAFRRDVDIHNMDQDVKNSVISLKKDGVSMSCISRITGLVLDIVRGIIVEDYYEEIKPIIAKLYEEGHNTDFIAKEVHISADEVGKLLKGMGYTLTKGQKFIDVHNMNSDKKKRVISLGESGASMACISRRTRISQEVVRRIMVDEKLFIPKNERVQEVQEEEWQPRYNRISFETFEMNEFNKAHQVQGIKAKPIPKAQRKVRMANGKERTMEDLIKEFEEQQGINKN